MKQINDQLGRLLMLKAIPLRIVSLVPSQTELLVDLGLGDYIVGLTKFCVHPVGFRKKELLVGGTKEVSYEKIKALKPDIILCNKEENTKGIVETLEIDYPVHVSDVSTLEDAIALIHQYGLIFNVLSNAEIIISKLEKEYTDFKLFIRDKPVRKVAYFIWKSPWMVTGGNTFIDALLKLNNFDNVYKNLNRYPEVNLNELSTTLDLILLSSEPFPFKETHITEFLNITKRDIEVRLVDGEYFSWYGSRLIKAFQYFKSLH